MSKGHQLVTDALKVICFILLLSGSGIALAVDTDGDGWTDLEEQEEGTDPNDPDDYPSTGGLPIWLLYQATQ